MKFSKVVNAGRRFAANTGAKIAAGGTALVASGAAMASGGGGSPGSAIAAELAGGKADVLLVITAVAVILGAIILWGYIKRAR